MQYTTQHLVTCIARVHSYSHVTVNQVHIPEKHALKSQHNVGEFTGLMTQMRFQNHLIKYG